MTIYISPSEIKKRTHIKLSTDKSHYLINVMRCRNGDTVSVIDGDGKAFQSKISSVRNGVVIIDILSEMILDTEPLFNLILCQGMIKGDKMDIVIQKATELGIKKIIPIITERGIVRETRKLQRWQKIAEEAAEQCGRTVIPKVIEPVEITQLLKSPGIIPEQSRFKGFIFWEEGGRSLSQGIDEIISHHKKEVYPLQDIPIFIIIGPEGGLTAQEVMLAEEKGFIRTTLGKRLLKSETASIIAVALIQFMLELGDEV